MTSRWTNPRSARLPPDWPRRRATVLRRARHRCQAPGCNAPATDVDHINAGDDHRLANLQALCEPHHQAKSSAEGHAARPPRTRPPEPHPGLPTRVN